MTQHPGPEFGGPLPGIAYIERPGAYAIILNPDAGLACVQGWTGGLYLPGGGIMDGEDVQLAMLREVREEIGWDARILDLHGHATQFLCAEGEGCFAIRATYFRLALTVQSASQPEFDLMWVPVKDALPDLVRESDAWAVSRALAG